MMVRYLKKLLPDAKRLKQESGFSSIQGHLLNPLLWQINRKSIARGAAIGLLIAFLPVPLQMLIAAVLAIVFTANLPIALVLTWVTNPFTFLPINYFIYRVGQFILHDTSSYHTVADFEWSVHSWQTIFQQLLQWLHSAGKPFLVGLPVVAVSSSLIGYFLVHIIWRLVIYWYLRKRKQRS